MAVALKGTEESHMPQPDGLVTVRIDKETGLLAQPGARNAIFEIYREELAPRKKAIRKEDTSTSNTDEKTVSPEDIF